MRTEQTASRSPLLILATLALVFVSIACGLGLLGVGGPKVRVENRTTHAVFMDAALLPVAFEEAGYVPERGWEDQIRLVGADASVLPDEESTFAAIEAHRQPDSRVLAITALTQDTVEVIYQEFFTVGQLKDPVLVITVIDQREDGREFP